MLMDICVSSLFTIGQCLLRRPKDGALLAGESAPLGMLAKTPVILEKVDGDELAFILIRAPRT